MSNNNKLKMVKRERAKHNSMLANIVDSKRKKLNKDLNIYSNLSIDSSPEQRNESNTNSFKMNNDLPVRPKSQFA